MDDEAINGKELQTFVFEDNEDDNGVPRWIKAKRKRIWMVLPCYCGKRIVSVTVTSGNLPYQYTRSERSGAKFYKTALIYIP